MQIPQGRIGGVLVQNPHPPTLAPWGGLLFIGRGLEEVEEVEEAEKVVEVEEAENVEEVEEVEEVEQRR